MPLFAADYQCVSNAVHCAVSSPSVFQDFDTLPVYHQYSRKYGCVAGADVPLMQPIWDSFPPRFVQMFLFKYRDLLIFHQTLEVRPDLGSLEVRRSRREVHQQSQEVRLWEGNQLWEVSTQICLTRVMKSYEVLREVHRDRRSQVVHQMEVRPGMLLQNQGQVLQRQAQVLLGRLGDLVLQAALRQVQLPMPQ